MPNVSFSGLFIVTVFAFAVPFLLSLAPAYRLPAPALEILVGIAIGPFGLNWVKVDLPIQILSFIGLAFLLFLAGLEVNLDRLKGRMLISVGLNFLLSFVLALCVGYLLSLGGQVQSPLFIAIVLLATTLGMLVSLLKDVDEITTDFGQLVLASATMAQFGSILLLSLLFSDKTSMIDTKLVLFGSFIVLAVAFVFVILRLERSKRITEALLKLQDTTAQIRVRGAFMLLMAFVALAAELGIEVLLSAFVAGVILRVIDPDRMSTHPLFRQKLEAIGFGVFVPVFLVATGLQLDLTALFVSPLTILHVPIFLAALLLVRGLPTLLYTRTVGSRRAIVAGFLQATSLPFIVAAAQMGMQIHVITRANGAALIAAGLLSVLIFPVCAMTILRVARKPVSLPERP